MIYLLTVLLTACVLTALVGKMVVNDKVRIEQRSGPTNCSRMAPTNGVFLEKLAVPEPVKNPPRVTEPKLSLCCP